MMFVVPDGGVAADRADSGLRARRRRARGLVTVVSALSLMAALVSGPPPASADTVPPAGVEETVSADPLPTAQINGVAWTQAVTGNTVWVGGEFTNARPAGAAPGVNTVPRANLMAYNLQTGVMTSWNPGANGVVRSIVASPDGARIYVAGAFTTIAGSARDRVAAFDATTGALLPWNPRANSLVADVATVGNTVWLVGNFSGVAGGSRSRLAAVNATTGALLPFSASATGGNGIRAIEVNPAGTKVVIGGSFTSTNGSVNPGRGLAALDAVTGALMEWKVNSLIRNGGTNAAMYALASDGDSVYGTGYDYGGGPEDDFEGTFRASWADGTLVWLEDCHGDNYSVEVSSGVVYTASHDHYCGNVGGFPQTSPKWTFHHSLAFAKEYHGKVLTQDIYGYKSYTGRPAGSLLHWYPNWQVGTYTGSSQAVWDVAGNSDYVLYGGEFLQVNNTPQQGLVRFAKKSIPPNRSGPERTGANFPITASSLRAGEVRLTWTANHDRDNQTLSYQVLRQDKGTTPVCTASAESNFWQTKGMVCTDTTVVPGTTYQYRVRAIDPMGNTATGDYASVTATTANRLGDYGLTVVDDGATHYWPLDEASGTTGADKVGGMNLTMTGATRGVAGPNAATLPRATQFNGTSGSFAATSALESGPNALTVEAWFKTTSTSGGKVVGLGNVSSGNSTIHDRSIYLDNSGRVTFGLYPSAYRTISSGTGFNNGQWHHAVGTLSPSGMTLYIDGTRIGTRTDATSGQIYSGYWRIGGDRVGSWPNAGSSGYLNGAISDVAIYPQALTATQVSAHYQLATQGTPPPNQPPIAAFTSTSSDLTVSVNGSSSTDGDGSIVSWAWAFGDGGTASSQAASHTYAAAGTYTVTLTVTDNRGATNQKSAQVTVSAPPAGGNVLARDLFERTATNGWGTADQGGAWTVSPTPAQFAVTGGAGVMTLATSTTQHAALPSVSSANIRLTAQFSVDKIANAQYITFVGRQVGADQYQLRVRVAGDGTVQLYVLRNGTAVGSGATVPGLVLSPGVSYSVTSQVTGTAPTDLRGRIWRSADAEPAAWHIERTDSTAALQGAGSVGLFSYVPSAANAYPLKLAFSAITVTDPTVP